MRFFKSNEANKKLDALITECEAKAKVSGVSFDKNNNKIIIKSTFFPYLSGFQPFDFAIKLAQPDTDLSINVQEITAGLMPPNIVFGSLGSDGSRKRIDLYQNGYFSNGQLQTIDGLKQTALTTELKTVRFYVIQRRFVCESRTWDTATTSAKAPPLPAAPTPPPAASESSDRDPSKSGPSIVVLKRDVPEFEASLVDSSGVKQLSLCSQKENPEQMCMMDFKMDTDSTPMPSNLGMLSTITQLGVVEVLLLNGFEKYNGTTNAAQALNTQTCAQRITGHLLGYAKEQALCKTQVVN